MFRFVSSNVLFVVLAVAAQPAFAGGVKGSMFNLPVGKNLELVPAGEIIDIRVTRFGTDTAIPLLDVKGQPLPLSQQANDGRVSFAGPTFIFTLGPSAITIGRQAVTIEFFREDAPGEGRRLTQRLEAVIVADDKGSVHAVDVSVPRPNQMTSSGIHCQLSGYPRCTRGHGRIRGLLRR